MLNPFLTQLVNVLTITAIRINETAPEPNLLTNESKGIGVVGLDNGGHVGHMENVSGHCSGSLLVVPS